MSSSDAEIKQGIIDISLPVNQRAQFVNLLFKERPQLTGWFMRVYSKYSLHVLDSGIPLDDLTTLAPNLVQRTISAGDDWREVAAYILTHVVSFVGKNRSVEPYFAQLATLERTGLGATILLAVPANNFKQMIHKFLMEAPFEHTERNILTSLLGYQDVSDRVREIQERTRRISLQLEASELEAKVEKPNPEHPCHARNRDCLYKPIDLDDWCNHDENLYYTINGKCFDARELLQHFEQSLLVQKNGNPFPQPPSDPWSRQLFSLDELEDFWQFCQRKGLGDPGGPKGQLMSRLMTLFWSQPNLAGRVWEGLSLETIIRYLDLS